MKSKRANFRTPLHIACSKNVYRPALQYVFFENDFIYATNGHIAVKLSFDYCDVIDKEKLNGKALHETAYAKILKFPFAQATEEGVLCWDENIKVTFRYAEGVVRPNLEKAIEGCCEEAVSKIGINPDNLAFVSKCLCHRGEERVRMMFSGKEKAITIEYPNHPNQWAYVMPMTLNE